MLTRLSRPCWLRYTGSLVRRRFLLRRILEPVSSQRAVHPGVGRRPQRRSFVEMLLVLAVGRRCRHVDRLGGIL
jgi:hypothetical protein